MALSNIQEQLLSCLRQVAVEIGESGRSLTPLIGELSACKLLGLTWQPSQGYDAVGVKGERIQIKTRKSWTTVEVNPKGRLGRFGKKGRYDFDEGMFVELDTAFEVKQIWQLDKETIIRAEATKTKGRGLHVGELRGLATKVCP